MLHPTTYSRPLEASRFDHPATSYRRVHFAITEAACSPQQPVHTSSEVAQSAPLQSVAITKTTVNESAENSPSNGIRGNMLAAIAHEVNQPLYAIKNFSLAALATLRQIDCELGMSPSRFEKLRTALDTIASQVERGSRIVAELKSLAGHHRPVEQTVDLHDVIRQAVQSIRLRDDLADYPIHLSLNAVHRNVCGESLQLELVITNLLLNAVDAARDLDATRAAIEIRTENNGGRIRIQVLDQGGGVDDANIPQLFEPYVTHKPHGLGLGLAICRDIVRHHDGEIGCRRRSPRGMEFFVDFSLA